VKRIYVSHVVTRDNYVLQLLFQYRDYYILYKIYKYEIYKAHM